VLLNLSKSVLLVCAMAFCAAAQVPVGSGNAPAVNTIVARMTAAQHRNKEQSHAITVKRDYQLLDHRQEQKAQVVAHITYMPPDQKEYTIESSYGGIGEKILRDVLDKETEQPRDPGRKELSTQNYDFQLLGSESLNGRQCYVLALEPKRGDKELIRGRVWVDSDTYNIRRIEGNPAKNPSWWIRDLYILMSFAEVDGMWLRTFTYAVANVRFKGKYEMVSRDLEYHPAAEQVVQRLRRRGRPGIITGAAFNP
jgi:Outer membrane lipoprotein-sorting protein